MREQTIEKLSNKPQSSDNIIVDIEGSLPHLAYDGYAKELPININSARSAVYMK